MDILYFGLAHNPFLLAHKHALMNIWAPVTHIWHVNFGLHTRTHPHLDLFWVRPTLQCAEQAWANYGLGA